MAFDVVVVEGPDLGERLSIEPSAPAPWFVGKSRLCGLQLTDPEVSGRHVRLELFGRRLRVIDQRSTNGTLLDDVQVQDAYWAEGQVLRIGSTALRFETREVALPAPSTRTNDFASIIGESPAMRTLYPFWETLAKTDLDVVIEGETGTGKERLARAIHERGPNPSAPFVVFDCAAAAPTLIEAQLFGYEKGAFTGAVRTQPSPFEETNGGTLFLDEIGDLDLALQKKLLRALENREVKRLGNARYIKFHARVLSATRRDLNHEVEMGRFQDDLLYRLARARIELPPLRNRREDIPLLVKHFCEEFGGREHDIPRGVIERWQDDPWPGNVRELRNAVERRIKLGDLADLSKSRTRRLPPPSSAPATDLPQTSDFLADALAKGGALAEIRKLVVNELERRWVEKLLWEHGGSVTRAAQASGYSERVFNLIRQRLRR